MEHSRQDFEAYRRLTMVADGIYLGTIRVGLFRRRKFWVHCWAIGNAFGGQYGNRGNSFAEVFEAVRKEIIDERDAA